MTMQERNAYQMKLAQRYARMHRCDLLYAIEKIARAFAIRYPAQYVKK